MWNRRCDVLSTLFNLDDFDNSGFVTVIIIIIIIIIIHRFCIALFSAVEHTPYAHVACDSERVTAAFYSAYY